MKKAPPEPTIPGEPTRISGPDFDSTQLSDRGDPTRVPTGDTGRSNVARLEPPPKEPPPPRDSTRKLHAQGDAAAGTPEEQLLHELKRMNHQLAVLTSGYRRYTLAFFGGIVRGLGAAIGATVVFALFLAAVSRLDTTPVIGNYVKRILTQARQGTPQGALLGPMTDESPTPEATATVSPSGTVMLATTAGAASPSASASPVDSPK